MKYIAATIRFILFFGLTFGIYTIWFIGSFFIPNKHYWRQIIFRKWARGFNALLGMKIEVIGEAPRPPFFLVANHLSYVDIPALRAVVEGIFVAKGEIEGWPLAGKMVRDIGMIYIDRERKRDIPRAGAEIIRRLGEGEGVIVFPEGTSTKGEGVLPFNSSFLAFAANTDLPVTYASITYRMAPGEGRASEMVCWWDDTTLLAHLWRLFSAPGFTAMITFGEHQIQNADRKELARELTDRVREKFIPVI
jgi:1-acyl-sn-glycerol-3-phosphate acyltransferase